MVVGSNYAVLVSGNNMDYDFFEEDTVLKKKGRKYLYFEYQSDSNWFHEKGTIIKYDMATDNATVSNDRDCNAVIIKDGKTISGNLGAFQEPLSTNSWLDNIEELEVPKNVVKVPGYEFETVFSRPMPAAKNEKQVEAKPPADKDADRKSFKCDCGNTLLFIPNQGMQIQKCTCGELFGVITDKGKMVRYI